MGIAICIKNIKSMSSGVGMYLFGDKKITASQCQIMILLRRTMAQQQVNIYYV